MEKITTASDFLERTTALKLFVALFNTGVNFNDISDENFWKVREQYRINDGTYTPVCIANDDKTRFLHVSVDDPAKVSYTKDAGKGRQDIQTRTTLAAYCDKFGLDITTANTPDAAPRLWLEDAVLKYPFGPADTGHLSIRAKLDNIQHLIDEVLADLE